jgi:trehalose 6-phosphate phosphatase
MGDGSVRSGLAVPDIRRQIIRDLSRAPDQSLFALDYDGTLAPIASRPEYGRPAGGVLEVLTALASHGATIALVTGREAAALLRVSGLAKVPGLRVYALYGAQRWYDGKTDSEPFAHEWDEVRSFLSTAVRPSTGLWVEDKGLSLVVHARGVEDPSVALAEVRPAIEAFVRPLGLDVHSGRAVVEIRLSEFDKGRVLSDLVGDTGASAVLVAGDDVGDLAAFRAARSFRSEQRAMWTVGIASDEAPEVSQSADLSVGSPDELVSLLAEIARATARP